MASETLRMLFLERWWTWDPTRPSLHSVLYHGFNVAEGATWIGCAAYVLARFLRHRKSWVEAAYALAFLTFGLSDFREGWALDSWLVWAKAANLVALLWIRRWVLRGLYPGARVL
jgi:hypothetical protein